MVKVSSNTVAVESADSAAVSVAPLLEQWMQAKEAELTATALRRAIEDQLVDFLPAPEEGERSYRIGEFQVVRANAINYSGKVDKVVEMANVLDLPDLTKLALDSTKLKNLRKTDPTSFALLVDAEAVKAEQGRPQFRVSLVPTARPGVVLRAKGEA